MPNVRLRDEPPPDDGAVVIRGGILEDLADSHLRDRARNARANIGLLAQSVLIAIPDEVAAVCQNDRRLARYHQVNLSVVRRLRQAGFPLQPTGQAPHYSVVFADLADQTLDRFRSCFDIARPNPPAGLPD